MEMNEKHYKLFVGSQLMDLIFFCSRLIYYFKNIYCKIYPLIIYLNFFIITIVIVIIIIPKQFLPFTTILFNIGFLK